MLFEKLTEKDRNLIESYINTFGGNCDAEMLCGAPAPLEYRLRHWDAAKSEHLAQLFGNKLILEKEIVFATPESQLRSKISRVLWDDTTAIGRFYKLITDPTPYTLDYDEYDRRARLFHTEFLACNRITHLQKPVKIECNGQTIQYSEGSKPVKVLGKLAHALGLDKEYEEFRLAHSQILNQKELKGSLCLSIHPLDYMTLSDNASGWSSCMSWQENGCYRIGTVEMMNSPFVVVAYLKSSKEDFHWRDGQWNNKHWRTLIIVHPETIVNVKNYPYENNELTKECLEWLRQLAITNLNWNYLSEPCQLWAESNYPIESLGHPVYFIPETDAMYNDFGDGNPWALLNPDISSRLHINYSGERNCMWCGDYLDLCGDESESYVFCESCADHGNWYYCECCNERVHEDDVYWANGASYCSCCYEEHCAECHISGDVFHKDELEKLYLTHTNDAPSDSDKWCYVYQGYVQGWRNIRSVWWSNSVQQFYIDSLRRTDDCIYYVNPADMTPHGLRTVFDICNEKELQDYLNEGT